MSDEMTKALEAAIRAAKLALFVINKQGIMPNDSWKSGFERDLKTAEDALAAQSAAPVGGPERISIEKLAKHFGVSIERAKAAQDDIGFMYRELAAPAPSTPKVRSATIEECAKVLDEAAQDWNRIRDPGMANNARSYAKEIRALDVKPGEQ